MLQTARQSQKVLIFKLNAKKLIFAKLMYFLDVHGTTHWHCIEIVIIINIIIWVGMGERLATGGGQGCEIGPGLH